MLWKPVPGFEDLYLISEYGKVRSLRSGRLMRPYLSRLGYWRVCLSKDAKTKGYCIHRLVARAFFGEPPEGKNNAAHNDGTRDNNHVSNLRWASAVENMADRKKHGNSKEGQKHYNCKLSDVEVRLIHHLVSQGTSQFLIAKVAAITYQHVRSIMKGETRRGAFA